MIQICSPIRPDFDRVKEYMREGLEHGVLSNFGPTYNKLANRLRTHLGIGDNRDIVLVSSGHVALMAAYAVLDTGRAVIPAYTFPSTHSAATIQGVFTTLCDINAETACPSIGTLDNYKYADTIVITTALSSIPDLKSISDYAKQNRKKLIVDGAPSFGTPGIYGYGDAFCLSFHATKSFGIGEGGAIICSRSNAAKVRQFINFGFDDKKNIRMSGMNGKISEYTCGIGLSILDDIPRAQRRRQRNAVIYKTRLKGLFLNSWVRDTVYQTFPIFAHSVQHAKEIRSLLTRKSVQHLQYYKPLGANFSQTTSLYDRNICIPIHSDLTIDQVHYICDLVLSV